MKLPSKDKSELYPLTESMTGIVHVTESGNFRVAIRPNEKLLPKEKFTVVVEDDDYFEFDTIEQLKNHLLENADENYKSQFLE